MRMAGKRLLAFGMSAAWFLWAAEACFAETGDGAPDFQGSSGSIYWMIFKVIGFLVVIIGIFMLIMKIISQKNQLFQSGRSIKSIGGLGLGQNKSVQLVQIGRSLYVLGVGNEVKLVDKIDDPEEMQYIIENFHAGANADFKSLSSMGDWLKRAAGRNTQAEELDVTPSFQAVFKEKMHKMANRKQQIDELMNGDQEINNERLNDKS